MKRFPTMPMTDLGRNLSAVVKDIRAGKDEPVVVTHHGAPAVVVLGARDFEALCDAVNFLDRLHTSCGKSWWADHQTEFDNLWPRVRPFDTQEER